MAGRHGSDVTTTIRDATPEDAEAVMAAHVAAIETLGPDAYSDEQVDAWAERPRGAEPYRENARANEEVFVVAEREAPRASGSRATPGEGDVVGFGHLRPPGVREDSDPGGSGEEADEDGKSTEQADGEGEVVAVYVHGDHADEGAGSALLAALEERAHERGLDSLVLTASLNAVGFYERHGYERVREAVHETTGGVELDVVVMRKRLAGVGSE